MTKPVLIYGPRGCGKIRNGGPLAEFFGLHTVTIQGKCSGDLANDTLYLCCIPPKHGACNMLAFDTAMALMEAHTNG